MMDFRFNGWGEKFASDQDNQLGRVLQGKGVFRCPMDHWDDFVLEGGSVEADGEAEDAVEGQADRGRSRN